MGELTLENLISHQLLIRSSMGSDVGLCHGKMGLALFFHHYFRHTGLQVYKDTADELMDELNEEIHTELPFGFDFGYAGIGWGVEYLIQNGFEDDDSLKICENIDKKLMEKDPKRMTDYSLSSGLEGLLHYVLAHVRGVKSKHQKAPFDDVYLEHVHQAVEAAMAAASPTESFKLLAAKYSAFYKNGDEFDYPMRLSFIFGDVEIKREQLNSFPLGLKDGMAGYLLKTIMEN